jgi:hypothetical protein
MWSSSSLEASYFWVGWEALSNAWSFYQLGCFFIGLSIWWS